MVMGVGMEPQSTGSAAPTGAAERIFALDTIRGFAVLGILLMNILGFGLNGPAYEFPIDIAGGNTGWNLWAWIAEMFYFEGTMRGLFTLLFGAGVVLYTSRLERAGLGLRSADLYFRRNLWLWIFGIFNAWVLLWSGDILYFYGLAALFLYVFRHQSVRRLLVFGLLILGIQSVVATRDYFDAAQGKAHAAAWEARQAKGEKLGIDEERQLNAWNGFVKDVHPKPEQLAEGKAMMRGSYASAAQRAHMRSWGAETEFFARQGLWECLGMMLIGMALFKSGAFTLGWSTRAYATMLLLGYGIGLSVNWWEIRQTLDSNFEPLASYVPWTITYDVGRVPTTLGHVALAMLLIRQPSLRTLLKPFAAAGQMALTNYLMQSVICLFVFTGAGLGMFGYMQRYQLYFVVLAIWVAELAWSPVWLANFRYGPMEWLWRSLTRWELQPMRLPQGSGSAVRLEDAATP
jgi:uncharacterized protein